MEVAKGIIWVAHRARRRPEVSLVVVSNVVVVVLVAKGAGEA